MTISPYDRDLDRDPANFQPLTPLGFLERAAAAPDRPAIVHGPLRGARPRCPRRVVFADIPKTPAGKAPKFALRKRARAVGRPPP